MPKSRIFCVSLPHTSRPIVSTLSTALDILREISPLVPIPGLRTAIDITSAILSRVQNVQNLGIDFYILAQETGNLMVAILREIHEIATNIESVELLLQTLRRIQDFVEEQCSRTWWYRFCHQINIKEQVKIHQQQLDSCCNIFQVTSIFQVKVLLESANARQRVADELLHEIKGLLDDQKNIIQTQERIISSGITALTGALSAFECERNQELLDNENRHEEVINAISELKSKLDDGEVFRQWDIAPTGVLIPQNSKNESVYFAKLRRDGQQVLLKQYGTGREAQEKFLRELCNWKPLWHPNVLQFLGRSALSAESPFIVVTGVSSSRRDVAHYVRDISANSNPSVAFMTGLRMLQGISAGLEYIRSNCRVGKYELQDCAKVSNFLLDHEGKVVLGQSILNRVPGKDVHQELRLEQWILEQFWCITEKILFGSAYDFTNWEVVSGKKGNPYMRALLRLAAWYADQGFTAATLRLDDLLNRLEGSYGPLTWTKIRSAFLETEGIKHNMYYRPSQSWEVELYDIGFVRDGKFTLLCNVAEQVDFELEHQPPFYYAAFPDIPPEETKLLNGITRYAFENPVFSAVGKTASGKHVKQSAPAFWFMIERTPSLLVEHRNQYPWLEVRDLIFIVGTNEFPQSAAFEWQATDEQDQGPQCTVFFFVFPDPPNDQPWGFWSFDPTPIPTAGTLHPKATAFVNKTPPQTVMFVQLENEDCPNIVDV